MRAKQALAPLQKESVTDQVFQALYSAIICLELLPGSKISEVEIANRLGVSRQPVRDAFYRLSALGFLCIRPQRATTISLISEQALRNARFIRTALELECLRAAIERATDVDINALESLLAQQVLALEAGEHLLFHQLDNQFHQSICEIAGQPDAWKLIREQKVHMERVRFLSLASNASSAIKQHRAILRCIKNKDTLGAQSKLRVHLSSVLQALEQIREHHADYFEE